MLGYSFLLGCLEKYNSVLSCVFCVFGFYGLVGVFETCKFFSFLVYVYLRKKNIKGCFWVRGL